VNKIEFEFKQVSNLILRLLFAFPGFFHSISFIKPHFNVVRKISRYSNPLMKSLDVALAPKKIASQIYVCSYPNAKNQSLYEIMTFRNFASIGGSKTLKREEI